VRFDATPENVDLSRSSNVLGYCHEGSTLYVHLAKGPRRRSAGRRRLGTYLIDANGDWEEAEGDPGACPPTRPS
jgi:hypothetical protein